MKYNKNIINIIKTKVSDKNLVDNTRFFLTILDKNLNVLAIYEYKLNNLSLKIQKINTIFYDINNKTLHKLINNEIISSNYEIKKYVIYYKTCNIVYIFDDYLYIKDIYSMEVG